MISCRYTGANAFKDLYAITTTMKFNHYWAVSQWISLKISVMVLYLEVFLTILVALFNFFLFYKFYFLNSDKELYYNSQYVMWWESVL